jgi:hypothetical protein
MNGDDLGTMEAARDAYSKIKPESPWRWVPVVFVLGMLVLLLGYGFAPQVAERGFGWVLAVLLLLWIVSVVKVGAHDAIIIAQQKAKATGAVRLNSHPVLARTMLAVGCLMFVSLIGVVWFAEYPRHDERDFWQRMLWSPVLPAASCLMVTLGWTRPWDLKVVERKSPGT